MVPLPSSPSAFALENRSRTYSRQWRHGDDHYLAVSFFISDSTTVVVGININHHVEFFDTISTMFFWLTVVMSVLAALYSMVIVTNGLRPLKRFEKYLTRIRPGNLNIRIPTQKLPSELEALSKVENAMLDRLDDGFNRLSDFSSDIAHELRTPLTNLTTQTQVVLASDRSVEEYRDILGSNLEELERINKTINDTLYLAKAENSLLYKNNEQLKVCEAIEQLIEYHNIVAEDKQIDIKLEGKGQLFCDKQMFQRAINNLLSNAIRHSDTYSTIKILIQPLPKKGLTVSISNTGDTIPADCLPFIFNRFYRKDTSREHDYGFGAGLGLAITKSIVETYNGTITAQSSNGKTKFEMVFPENKPTVSKSKKKLSTA
jgi:two-component system heavy metal sensor histidine kinase CusS